MVAVIAVRDGEPYVESEVHTVLRRRCAFTVIALPTGFRVATVVEDQPGYNILMDELPHTRLDTAQQRVDVWNASFDLAPADVWQIVASAMEASDAWTADGV